MVNFEQDLEAAIPSPEVQSLEENLLEQGFSINKDLDGMLDEEAFEEEKYEQNIQQKQEELRNQLNLTLIDEEPINQANKKRQSPEKQADNNVSFLEVQQKDSGESLSVSKILPSPNETGLNETSKNLSKEDLSP